jgi:hypothetical protein
MRGRVCGLQLQLDLANTVFLRSVSHRTNDHILLPKFWDSPNLEVCICFPQEQGGPDIGFNQSEVDFATWFFFFTFFYNTISLFLSDDRKGL